MVADSAAGYLSEPFEQAVFEFRRRTLSGERRIEPRYKRAIEAVAGGDCIADARSCFGTLNWAVGQVYTAHDFPPADQGQAADAGRTTGARPTARGSRPSTG